jgi:molybdopterin biosynthesis enzyme MoaB
MSTHDTVRIGLVSISDRASSGVYEDKGIPALQAWLNTALKNPDLREKFLTAGAEPVGGTPEQFAAHIKVEVPRWVEVIRTSGAKAE